MVPVHYPQQVTISTVRRGESRYREIAMTMYERVDCARCGIGLYSLCNKCKRLVAHEARQMSLEREVR